jgi:hypothetical protein
MHISERQRGIAEVNADRHLRPTDVTDRELIVALLDIPSTATMSSAVQGMAGIAPAGVVLGPSACEIRLKQCPASCPNATRELHWKL